MKKSIKKHISTALALLLLANVLFSSNSADFTNSSNMINTYNIVDLGEIE